MKRMCIFLIPVFLVLLQGNVLAEEPDWQAYAAVLSKHVKPGVKNRIALTTVDYQKLKSDPLFHETLKTLEDFDPDKLATKNERLAFYINAYNIYALKMVAGNLPLESIRDVGSFFSPVWKKDIGKIAGKVTSLDEIEHDILRKMGEPRIHMAIVCASVSCPDLLDEPYVANRLFEQMDNQASLFINNSRKGVKVTGNELYISKIFDWFEDDFDAGGGVTPFILKYRDTLSSTVRVKGYLNYDWDLNIH